MYGPYILVYRTALYSKVYCYCTALYPVVCNGMGVVQYSMWQYRKA
jgi:hypothetical protein